MEEGPSNFLRAARNTKIGKYAQFNQTESVTNIHHHNHNHGGTMVIYQYKEKQSIVPIKHNSKEIDPEDIIYREHISSQVLELHIGRLTPSTANAAEIGRTTSRLRRIKVRKQVYTAEIVQFIGRSFTVYTLEPEDKDDKEALRTVWRRVYEVSSQKSLLLPQRFGIGRSKVPMLIVHDELVDGRSFWRKYLRNKIIYNYLWYRIRTSILALRDGGDVANLSIPVSDNSHDWTINLRTGSWHYDLTSIAVLEPIEEDEIQGSILYDPPPLPQHTRVELDPQKILSVFEKHLGGFLHSIALAGETGHFDELTGFAPHGLLTFGAVVDRKGGIVAHFSSIPAPEWLYYSYKSAVDAQHSKSDPSRVDLSITNVAGPSRAELHFSLRLPEEDRQHLRVAYLTQSVVFHDKKSHKDLAFIDEVHFALVGTFHHNPSTHSPPAYLFVPPIHVKLLHGLPCIEYPFPNPLFYWSLDRKGLRRIPTEDWGKYGIPELRVETWLGSLWYWLEYQGVEEYLQQKGYDLDGRRYAQDRNYPELIRGDPHDIRVIENEQPTEGQLPTVPNRISKAGLSATIEPVGETWRVDSPEQSHAIQRKSLGCPQPASTAPSAIYRSQVLDERNDDTDDDYGDIDSDFYDTDASSPEVDELCVRLRSLALD